MLDDRAQRDLDDLLRIRMLVRVVQRHQQLASRLDREQATGRALPSSGKCPYLQKRHGQLQLVSLKALGTPAMGRTTRHQPRRYLIDRRPQLCGSPSRSAHRPYQSTVKGALHPLPGRATLRRRCLLTRQRCPLILRLDRLLQRLLRTVRAQRPPQRCRWKGACPARSLGGISLSFIIITLHLQHRGHHITIITSIRIRAVRIITITITCGRLARQRRCRLPPRRRAILRHPSTRIRMSLVDLPTRTSALVPLRPTVADPSRQRTSLGRMMVLLPVVRTSTSSSTSRISHCPAVCHSRRDRGWTAPFRLRNRPTRPRSQSAHH